MPETSRKRLKVYHEQTEPLKAFYENEGLLAKVDGTGSISEITEGIIKAAEEIK